MRGSGVKGGAERHGKAMALRRFRQNCGSRPRSFASCIGRRCAAPAPLRGAAPATCERRGVNGTPRVPWRKPRQLAREPSAATGNFRLARGDSAGRGCEAPSASASRCVQLDSRRSSDMLVAPEMFEISGVSSPSARCFGRGRRASRVAVELGDRRPAGYGSGRNPGGLPVALPRVAAPDECALASKPLHTDEWLVDRAASGAARAGNWCAQWSAGRGIPRDRSRIGGGTGLAAHTVRMLSRRRVEPLNEEKAR